MPLTQLDPTPALVLIDLQKGIANASTVHPADQIIDRAARLAAAFRQRNFPVVLVNVTGTAPGRTEPAPPRPPFPPDWSELVPQLNPNPTDLRISKQRWGAFLGTNLDAQLRQRNVTQIFLAGIATSIGVESTARSAYDLGYNVVLITDAMTDRNLQAHQHSIQIIFPRLGQTDTTDNILSRLQTP